jgi:hypothetical protein
MRLIIPPITSHIPYMVRRSSRNTRVPPLFMKRLGAVISSPFIRRVGLYKLFGPIEKNSPNQKTACIFSLNMAYKNSLHNNRKNIERKNMPPTKLNYPFGFGANVSRFMSCLFHGLHLLLHPFAHDHLINTLSYFSIKTNRSLTRETGVGKP